jgi:adenylate cyclase
MTANVNNGRDQTAGSGETAEPGNIIESTRLLKLLYEINKTIATKDSLDEVFATLAWYASKETDAQRSTVFLHDEHSNELFSRFAQGEYQHEIRLLDNEGIAGYVFQQKQGIIVEDAYNDARFNRDVDKETGYKTRDILCAPIITVRGEIIGVIQSINSKHGTFNPVDLHLISTIATQVAIVVQGFQTIEHLNAARAKELEFINIVSETTSMLALGPLLQKVMGEATRMLQAERSTLFLNNDKTAELWSQVGQGLKRLKFISPTTLALPGRCLSREKRSIFLMLMLTCGLIRPLINRPVFLPAQFCVCQ